MYKRITFFYFCLSIFYNIGFSQIKNNQNISQNINGFAFNIYKQIISNKKFLNSNIALSPYSIYVALSLLSAGAEKQTLQEIRKALNVNDKKINIHSRIYELNNVLLNITDNKDYTIHIANSIWLQLGWNICAKYQYIAQKFYKAKIANLDFAKNPDESRNLINKWVELNTNKLILKLLPPSSIDHLTTLVLINALYFKGLWNKAFDKRLTKNDTFFGENKTKIKVPMMQNKLTTLYFENKDLQIIRLNYKRSIYSMVILLPKQQLKDLELKINYKTFSELLDKMVPKEVVVFVPRYIIDSGSIKLNDYLISLGINKAFHSAAAEFGKLVNGIKKLYVSLVVHKAKISINEEGSEAAAATGVVVSRASLNNDQPLIFKANKPFLYFIVHNDSNTILFMGKLLNPKGD